VLHRHKQMPGGDGGASAASAAGGGGRDPYFTAVAPNPGAQNTNAGVPGADWFAMVPQMCLMMAMCVTQLSALSGTRP